MLTGGRCLGVVGQFQLHEFAVGPRWRDATDIGHDRGTLAGIVGGLVVSSF
jgi:hypothetical protein